MEASSKLRGWGNYFRPWNALIKFQKMDLHVNQRLVRQLRTVGLGVAVSVACYTFAKVVLMTHAGLVPANVILALLNLSLVASGAAIAYAVIRQQFLGVRHVLLRGLFYGTIAVLFAFLYLALVRPITTFVAQYSAASRDIFEAGFVRQERLDARQAAWYAHLALA